MTNDLRGPMVAWLETHGVKNKWPIDDEDCICDVYKYAREFDTAFAALESALRKAEDVIRQWHSMRMNPDAEERAWLIYRNAAPEMEPIRAALALAEGVRS